MCTMLIYFIYFLLVVRSVSLTVSRSPPSSNLLLSPRTIATLDYPLLIDALRSQCSTLPGRMRIDECSMSRPSASTIHESRVLYETVEEVGSILTGGSGTFRGVIYSGMLSDEVDLVDLIESARLQKRILEVDEVGEVRRGVEAIHGLRTFFEDNPNTDCPHLKEIGCPTKNLDEELVSLLSNAFDGDELSGEYFPELKRLRRKIDSQRRKVEKSILQLLQSSDVKSKLAEGESSFNVINGRYTLPITPTYKKSVGIVHGRSRSDKTLYIEPYGVVEETNDLRESEGMLSAEEARILRMITTSIISQRMPIQEGLKAVATVDCFIARYRLGEKLGGRIPSVSDEKVINVKGALHPCLLLRQGRAGIVANDVSIGLDGNKCLIVSGPNSGGKTIVLKLLGIFALMAREGIPIPCDEFHDQPRVDFFDSISADIGDTQNLASDLSTFSGHMKFANDVLSISSLEDQKDHLVLFDELGTGTAPQQGCAIAQAILEDLVKNDARVAVTTHFLEIKNLASDESSKFLIGGMRFEDDKPSYRLQMGKTGESYAFATAKKMQVDEGVIERAKELLSEESSVFSDLALKLEEESKLVDKERQSLKRAVTEAEELKRKLVEEKEKLEVVKLNVRRETARSFERLMSKKEKELARLVDDLVEKAAEGGSTKKVVKLVKDSQGALKSIKTGVQGAINDNFFDKVEGDLTSSSTPLSSFELTPSYITPGFEFIVTNQNTPLYNNLVEFESFESNEKVVNVNSFGLSFKLKRQDVGIPDASLDKTRLRSKFKGNNFQKKVVSKRVMEALDEIKKSSGKNSSSRKGLQMRTESNTCDLRGLDFTDGQAAVLDFIASKITSNYSVIYVLHGHEQRKGSGLKSKIREWLKKRGKAINVKSFEPGRKGDGGDAYTRVELTNG